MLQIVSYLIFNPILVKSTGVTQTPQKSSKKDRRLELLLNNLLMYRCDQYQDSVSNMSARSLQNSQAMMNQISKEISQTYGETKLNLERHELSGNSVHDKSEESNEKSWRDSKYLEWFRQNNVEIKNDKITITELSKSRNRKLKDSFKTVEKYVPDDSMSMSKQSEVRSLSKENNISPPQTVLFTKRKLVSKFSSLKHQKSAFRNIRRRKSVSVQMYDPKVANIVKDVLSVN